MAQIVVPIPDEYVGAIATALRLQVADEAALSDADVIEAFARSIIETLVIQHAGSAAAAAVMRQAEAAREAAEAEARAMLDVVRAADV